MPSVCVVGMSGATILEEYLVEPDALVSSLTDAVTKAMGIENGIVVTLLFGNDRLKDDQLVSDTGLEDGSTVIASIQDILFGIRATDLDLPVYGGSNIAEAAQQGAWHDVIRLVEAKADMNAVTGGDGYDYNAVMHLAAVPHWGVSTLDPTAAAQMMQWLLISGANPNQPDRGGKTALHAWGKHGGCLEQGQVLLDYGADVNHAMSGGYTPLWYVRNYKRPEAEVEDGYVGVAGAERRRRELKAVTAADSDRLMWVEAEGMLVEKGAIERPESL